MKAARTGGVVAAAVAPQGTNRAEELQILFLAHQERVLRAAYRITGSMADAEDIAQSVFLRLLQRPEPACIGRADSYFYRAAVNASLDLLRSRAAEKSGPIEAAPGLASQASGVSPERNYRDAELRTWLRQALGRLGARAAEMFVLRYLEDHDNREIARMLNTSQAVVAVILHRARVRLRKELHNAMRGER